MRMLLTGSTGFVGRHIAHSPHARGCVLVRATRATTSVEPDEIALGPEAWSVSDLEHALDASGAEVVIHAAGTTQSVDGRDLFAANAGITANLLEAVAARGGRVRLIVVGSAAEYGPVRAGDLPVQEDHACRPEGPYGVSKYAQTLLALAAHRKGAPVLVARLFNVLGGGMTRHLALPSFARRIAAAPDVDGEIRVGRVDVSRDFLAIDECARILLGLARMSRWPWPVVNVCSGVAVPLSTLLHSLIASSGKSVAVRSDPTLLRPGEMASLQGSTVRLGEVGLVPSAPDLDAICRSVMAEAAAEHGRTR